MKYILRLEDGNGNGANITKPCNWKSVNEAKEQAKCLEMTGQMLVIRLHPKPVKTKKILRKTS
jgi:hypothetical protein